MKCICPYCRHKSNRIRRLNKNPFPIKTLEKLTPPDRQKTTHCSYPNCKNFTRKGKSYCSEHILESPYAQQIVKQQNSIDYELQQVAKKGENAIFVDSPVVKEIVQGLKIEGDLKQGELAKLIDIPLAIAIKYLRKMEFWGMVTLVKEGRSLLIILENDYPTPFVRLNEIAKLVKLHPSTVRKLVRKGAPVRRHKGKLYFNITNFTSWYKKYRAEIAAEQRKHLKRVKKKHINEITREVKKQNKGLVTRQELAATLNVSLSTVQHWIEQGVPHEEVESTNYLGGKSGNKIRLFDVSKVVGWRKLFTKSAMKRRKTARAYGTRFWNRAIKFALEQGLNAAVEKFNIAKGTLQRKIKEKGVELPNVTIGNRTLNRDEVAKILKVKPVTIYKWAREMNAPHDRVTQLNGREILLFNAEELEEWLQDFRKRKIQQQHQKIIKYLEKVGYANTKQICEAIGVGRDAAKARLEELIADDIIAKSGISNKTRYELI